MMKDIEWIFSGIGTQIICWVIGLASSLFAGYKFLHRVRHKQVQKAGKNSIQIQRIDDSVCGNISKTSSIKQKQKAGDDSLQVQLGGTKDAKQ